MISDLTASFNGLAPTTREYVLKKLRPDELEVACKDPIMNDADDLLILAMMRDLPVDQLDWRADLQVKKSFWKDYSNFTAHWVQQAVWYLGIDIYKMSGKPVDDTSLNMSAGLKMRNEGRRARVFYSLKHPDRMVGLDNSGEDYRRQFSQHQFAAA